MLMWFFKGVFFPEGGKTLGGGGLTQKKEIDIKLSLD